jgi:plasmid maintenance system antidote protein VapI
MIKVTDTVMAKELGISSSRFSQIKRGLRHTVTCQEVTSLAKYFDTPLEIWLKGGDIQKREIAINLKKCGLIEKEVNDLKDSSL